MILRQSGFDFLDISNTRNWIRTRNDEIKIQVDEKNNKN